MTPNITFTESAITYIKSKIEEYNTRNNSYKGTRIGVSASGCSGFSPFVNFNDQTVLMNDVTFEVEGIRLKIDSKSLKMLQNTQIDYEHTLMRQGWIFSNPNATSSCGCGKSFSI